MAAMLCSTYCQTRVSAPYYQDLGLLGLGYSHLFCHGMLSPVKWFHEPRKFGQAANS
jgi:hypothetical protein